MGSVGWLAWVAYVAWVEILAWVTWVHIILAWLKNNGVGQKNGVGLNVLLFNHSRIQQVLQLFFAILNLVRASFIQMKLTCVWRIFRFTFKFILSHLFLNCGYPSSLTCKTLKITTKEQIEKREKKTKKIILKSKKELVKSHSFMTYVRKNILKFRPLPLPYLLSPSIHKHPILI